MELPQHTAILEGNSFRSTYITAFPQKLPVLLENTYEQSLIGQ